MDAELTDDFREEEGGEGEGKEENGVLGHALGFLVDVRGEVEAKPEGGVAESVVRRGKAGGVLGVVLV